MRRYWNFVIASRKLTPTELFSSVDFLFNNSVNYSPLRYAEKNSQSSISPRVPFLKFHWSVTILTLAKPWNSPASPFLVSDFTKTFQSLIFTRVRFAISINPLLATVPQSHQHALCNAFHSPRPRHFQAHQFPFSRRDYHFKIRHSVSFSRTHHF